jgi:hypothetical protein
MSKHTLSVSGEHAFGIFGKRELLLAADLLAAYANSEFASSHDAESFSGEDARIVLHSHTGEVFLEDAHGGTLHLNDEGQLVFTQS